MIPKRVFENSVQRLSLSSSSVFRQFSRENEDEQEDESDTWIFQIRSKGRFRDPAQVGAWVRSPYSEGFDTGPAEGGTPNQISLPPIDLSPEPVKTP
jgi:hypothetical protein